jgi:hypothetical protein
MIRWFGTGWVLASLMAAGSAAAMQSLPNQTVTTPAVVSTPSLPAPAVTTPDAEPPPPPPPPPPLPTAPSPPQASTAPPATSNDTSLFGRRGVVELGGFCNFTGATGFTSIEVSPTVGYFVADNIEITGILGFDYVHQSLQVDKDTEVSDHKLIVRMLAEPSFHLPLNKFAWAFLGLGIGVASVPADSYGSSMGFDLAPRIGANFLIGHSGIVSPALFVDYTTSEALQSNGDRVLGVNTTYGLQAGYTVLW